MDNSLKISRDPRRRQVGAQSVGFEAEDADGVLMVIVDHLDWGAIVREYSSDGLREQPTEEAFLELEAIASARKPEEDARGRAIRIP